MCNKFKLRKDKACVMKAQTVKLKRMHVRP